MKNHVVLIIVLFLLVLVTANCTSSNNSELLYIDEKGIIHIEIEKILDNNELKRKQFNLSEIADSINLYKAWEYECEWGGKISERYQECRFHR